jgi:hypothetical protein
VVASRLVGALPRALSVLPRQEPLPLPPTTSEAHAVLPDEPEHGDVLHRQRIWHGQPGRARGRGALWQCGSGLADRRYPKALGSRSGGGGAGGSQAAESDPARRPRARLAPERGRNEDVEHRRGAGRERPDQLEEVLHELPWQAVRGEVGDGRFLLLQLGQPCVEGLVGLYVHWRGAQ